jgi:hypothetical protein
MTARCSFFALSALVLSAVAPLPAQVLIPDYEVTIDYEIFDTGDPDTYFQLAGQSAYLQFLSGSSTSGGQLDGVSGPGGGSIVYTEVFPPSNLTDYQTFAYFGLVETRSFFDDAVLSTNFVVALLPSFAPAPGQTFADVFSFLSSTEDEVVTALSTSFDSPEFFAVMTEVANLSGGRGDIALPQLGRPGHTMDLIAFLPGSNGNEAVGIGTLGTSVAVVPEPATPILAALATLGLLRRRRQSPA